MSSSHRRFHVAAPPEGERARIEGDEAVHAFAVFRVRVGDAVTLFDGSGVEYEGVVDKASKREIDVRILSSAFVDREPPIAVTVAAAVPKSAHFDDAVRAACELGLAAFVPLETERTLVHPSPHRIDRWRRIAIEASKQSRRTRVTSILKPRSFRDAIEGGSFARRAILTASRESAIPFPSVVDSPPAGGSLLLLVGPEGDFTTDEVDAALERGVVAARLTASTLRVETALVAAVAAAVIIARRV